LSEQAERQGFTLFAAVRGCSHPARRRLVGRVSARCRPRLPVAAKV